MKKLLILAYDFPPYVSVGGLRPYSWYRYMKEFGVEPIVVTRQWENRYGNELDYISPSASKETIIEKTEYGTIIRTPYRANLSNRLLLKYGKERFRLIRKFITAYYEIAQFFFFVGTKSGLYRGAKEYLKNNKADYIIATGAPHILFKYASKLSKKHNVPWIADYRDPWTQAKSRSRNKFLKLFNRHFEVKFTKNAEFITTVSELFSYQIKTLVKKDFHIIENGYNPEFAKDIESIEQEDKIFTLAYAGTIYSWHPLKSILSTLNKIVENNDIDFRLQYIGTNKNEEIKSLIETKYLNLKNKVEIYDKMPQQEMFKTLAKANALILHNDFNVVGTKIYDYLLLNRYILLCFKSTEYGDYSNVPYTEGVKLGDFPMQQEEIINSTSSGRVINDPNHFEDVFFELYTKFQKEGKIEAKTKNIEKYSRKYQTAKLAEILLDL